MINHLPILYKNSGQEWLERLTTWIPANLSNIFTVIILKNKKHNCSIHDGYCKMSYSTILEKFRAFIIRSDMKNCRRWLLWKKWIYKRWKMLWYIKQVIFDSFGKTVILLVKHNKLFFVYSTIYQSWFLLRLFKIWKFYCDILNFLLLPCISYYCFDCMFYHQIIYSSLCICAKQNEN